jgi:hypothetical protein
MATNGRPAGVNPYARLGLAPGASLAEVKRAYRRLAMQLHPDHAGPGGTRTFLAVKAAYEWIVAHPSFALPGDLRAGFARRTTRARPVPRERPTMVRSMGRPSATRSSWPGGRWYWDGLRARSARARETGSSRPAGPAPVTSDARAGSTG